MKFAFTLAAAAALALATPAVAGTFKYNFTAEYQFGTADDDTVDTIADDAEALIGTVLTGTLTFGDTFVSGNAASRLYAPLSMTIDQMDLTNVLPFSGTRLQNDAFGTFDAYSSETDLPMTNGDVVSQIFFTLRDTDQSIIGDTGFPRYRTFRNSNLHRLDLLEM